MEDVAWNAARKVSLVLVIFLFSVLEAILFLLRLCVHDAVLGSREERLEIQHPDTANSRFPQVSACKYIRSTHRNSPARRSLGQFTYQQRSVNRVVINQPSEHWKTSPAVFGFGIIIGRLEGEIVSRFTAEVKSTITPVLHF